MITLTLRPPGAKYGPCNNDCNHTFCCEIRKMAKTKCTICGKEIGYNKKLYEYEKNHLVHAACYDETSQNVYKWCDNSILDSAETDGFSRNEITKNMDGIGKLTKSPRIIRLIRMAYWRGCRRGVDMVRQANTPVALSKTESDY